MMVTTTGFIRCLCEHKYGDNSNCPRHGSLMSRTSPPPSSPSYTLAELKALMKQWLNGEDNIAGSEELLLDWHLSLFVEWLAKRERGEVRGDAK